MPSELIARRTTFHFRSAISPHPRFADFGRSPSVSRLRAFSPTGLSRKATSRRGASGCCCPSISFRSSLKTRSLSNSTHVRTTSLRYGASRCAASPRNRNQRENRWRGIVVASHPRRATAGKGRNELTFVVLLRDLVVILEAHNSSATASYEKRRTANQPDSSHREPSPLVPSCTKSPQLTGEG